MEKNGETEAKVVFAHIVAPRGGGLLSPSHLPLSPSKIKFQLNLVPTTFHSHSGTVTAQ